MAAKIITYTELPKVRWCTCSFILCPHLGINYTIRQRREAMGWTQAQFARKMRTKQPAVARLEKWLETREGRAPSLRTIKKAANAVGTYVEVKLLPRNPTTVLPPKTLL